MIVLTDTPRVEEEWYAIYNDPRLKDRDGPNPKWIKSNLEWFKLPYPMVLSWDEEREIQWVQMHYLIGSAFIDGLEEVAQNPGIEYTTTHKHNRWGGCFNYRPQRGDSGKLSTHAFAAAFDINPALAPFGSKSRQPDYLVEVFKKRGFVYGGDWDYPDGMHYQAGRGL